MHVHMCRCLRGGGTCGERERGDCHFMDIRTLPFSVKGRNSKTGYSYTFQALVLNIIGSFIVRLL